MNIARLTGSGIAILIGLSLLIWDPAVGLPMTIVSLIALLCIWNRHPVRAAVFAVFVVIMSAVLLETILLAARHSPAIATLPALREIARTLYMLDRDMIQAEAEASVYDARLGYTLRPGSFGFAFGSVADRGYSGGRRNERYFTPYLSRSGDCYG